MQGLTLSPKQALLAKQNARRTGTVDLVWTMEASEHFRDKSRYFCNAALSLRPAGRLLLTAWTGSMRNPGVGAVANALLCPSLQTTEVYQQQIEEAGLSIRYCEDLSRQVTRTWEICLGRAHRLRALIRMFPSEVREFVHGISTILEAFRSGDLTYSIILAEK